MRGIIESLPLLILDSVIIRDPSFLLTAGMKLIYFRRPWREPLLNDYDLPILYQDEHVSISTFQYHLTRQIVVVNKPEGMPTMPGGGHFMKNTALKILERRLERPINPVHRLGRGTTGVLVFAYVCVLFSFYFFLPASQSSPPESYPSNFGRGKLEKLI